MKDLKKAAKDFCDTEKISGKSWITNVHLDLISIDDVMAKFAQHLVDKGELVEAPFNSNVNENCERAKWLMTNRLFDTEEYGEHPDVCELYGIIEDLQKTIQSNFITIQEIEAQIYYTFPMESENSHMRDRQIMRNAIQWYRDQLNKK